MPTYSKIQFIAYEIYTAPYFAPDGGKVYLGLDNDYDDISARLRWTYEVLTQAAAKADRSSDTLKLFMMPEFFFRGANGAYDMDIVDRLIGGLQHLVRGADWRDWLCVFGTCIGRSSPTDDAATIARGDDPADVDPAIGTALDPDGADEAYNIALVQKGGWAPDSNMLSPAQMNAALEGTCFITMKEFMSDKDFIMVADLAGDTGIVWERIVHLDRAGAPSDEEVIPGREERVVGYDGAGLFAIDGIEFGLEICLDHALSRLKNSPRPAGAPPIQVQLVPSCGMSLKRKAMVTMVDGLGFNVDGVWNEAAGDYGADSQLARVVQASSIVQPNAVLGPLIPPTSRVPLANAPADFARLFARGPGVLGIYAPQPIPGVEVGCCKPAGRGR